MKPDPKEAIRTYLQHVSSSPYQTVRNRIILERLMPARLDNMKVLDFGCGMGYFSIEMAKRGAYVEGVDLSPYAIEAAKVFAEDWHVGHRCSFTCI